MNTYGLPSMKRMVMERSRWELTAFFRQREAVVFTFGLPIGVYVIYAVTMSGDLMLSGQSVNHDRYMLPGLAAAAVLLTSFQGTALSIAADRESGAFRRLQTSPLDPRAFLGGKIALVLITSAIQLAILIGIAAIAFEVPLPVSWSRFLVTYTLGCFAGTACGVALGGVMPNPATASSVVPGITLLMQFVCGVFFIFTNLPVWLQAVASWLPLTWLARGMRSAFLPENLSAAEAGGSWDLGVTYAVIAAWALVGLAVALRTRRWGVR